MANMSGVKMTPVDGGDGVVIPSGKTTIGRGPFLQVTDKRVSRNHAVLEIDSDGKLVITPIHTNPCFFKLHGTGSQTILHKDQPKVLQHGDIVALLPDKLAYHIEYSDNDNKEQGSETNNAAAPVEKNEDEAEAEQEDKPVENEENGEPQEEVADAKAEEMALPLGKKRTLPEWMLGAGKRVGVGRKPKQKKTAAPAKVTTRTVAPKPATKTKAKPVATRAPRKAKTRVVSDDDDDFINDHNEEEDEEDFGDDELVTKKKRRGTRRSGRSTRRSRRARDSDSDEPKPKRRPRAASLKKPKYTDEDFVISDDDYREPSSDEGSEGRGRRRRGSVDSDFVADDDESGSDWESTSRKPVKPKPTPKVKSPPAGRGRGAASRRGAATGRGRARKRIIQHSDDNASEEDKYIPRSSKRRAAVAAVSRMKQPSDYEDDDFDDVLPARPLPAPKPLVTKTGRPRGRPPRTAGRGRMPASDDDDSDGGQNNVDDHDSSEDSPPKKKKRASHKAKPTCHYGKECYRTTEPVPERKNPKHFEEFAHPWMKSPVTDHDEDDEDFEASSDKMDSPPIGGGRQKRAAALKQKEKLAAMNEASGDDDDDEVMNGSHDDAGAEGSDFDMDTSSSHQTKEKVPA